MVATAFETEHEVDDDRFHPHVVHESDLRKAVMGYFRPGQFVPVHAPGSKVVITVRAGERNAGGTANRTRSQELPPAPGINGYLMPETSLDLREVPPPERHPMIHDAFEELDSGEALEIVNDHEPKPLFYEFRAEVDAFDADNYSCEEREEGQFVATLPKA